MADANRSCVVVLGSFVQAHWWTVPCLPAPGESRMASSLVSELGGKGLNVGIGLRRLGVDVVLLIGVGKDPAASELRALLDQEKIPSTHVHALAEKSGHGAGLVDAFGENTVVVFPGANLALSPKEVQLAVGDMAQAALVYGQLEIPQETVLAAFVHARKLGIKTVLNPSPMAKLGPALLELADTLVLNWIEACQLWGIGNLDMPLTIEMCATLLQPLAKEFAGQWRGDAVVVTLGALGCLGFSDKGRVLHLQAANLVRRDGDTAGAGDGFSAGLCWALAQHHTLQQALRLGNACGSAVASSPGVLENLPHWADLLHQGYLPDAQF